MNPTGTPSDDQPTSVNPAADLIRQKLNQLYTEEPSAGEELQESQATTHRSVHQQYMYDLSQSGKSLAEIQTAWHNYYLGLPDNDKHQVWQEFYTEHTKRGGPQAAMIPVNPIISLPATPAASDADAHPPTTRHKSKRRRPALDPRSVTDIKQQLLKRITSQPKTKKASHLKSLLFGLSSGLIVIAILLFGLFNERFLAPFVSPSRSVSATPIIIDANNSTVGPEPKIIIPKTNVEIPVIYTEPSIDEAAVQRALENGVLHYATTSNPGELGHGAIFGHSSNNILNKGNYKFAFVLLKRLETGDTFILQKDGKRYVYRVFSKKVVKPEDVSVLADGQGKPATFSLITCDPPGTSLNRLVVTGEQISPDPASNVVTSAKPAKQLPQTLPSNSESLWRRLTKWITQ